MKRYLTSTIAMMTFLGVVAITAQAQVFGSKQVRARIPFAFQVGKTTLPAGEYTITVVNPSSDRKVLQIRSKDRNVSALIQTTAVTSSNTDDAKLVFNRYGDTYFFAQARMAGDSTTWTALKTSAERSTEHAIASRGRKSTVSIAAE